MSVYINGCGYINGWKLEGISKAEFEAGIAHAKAHANVGEEKHIRCHAMDVHGKYHDPETQAFWEGYRQDFEEVGRPEPPPAADDEVPFRA